MTQANIRNAGFTLIEVLVAITIFATGMLGMLSLLANSISFSNAANETTLASTMAYQMADHVRGNPTQFLLYNNPTDTSTEKCFTTDGCAVKEMVQSEVAMWYAEVAQKLPQGKAKICRDSSPNDGDPDEWACDGGDATPIAVKVCWKKTLSGGDWVCYRVRV